MGILDDVVARLRLNVDRVSQFVNGGDNEMVDTDGGPIRTLKKFLKDNQAVIDAIPPDLAGKESKANKDQPGGYAGLTQRKINIYNSMGTVLSFMSSLATVERAYLLPDASGQLALKSDISGTNSGTNTGDETKATILEKLQVTVLSGTNTGDQTLESLGAQAALGFVPADSAKIGQANGIAPLDQDAKIPAVFLPSYVDDVVEFDTQLMLPLVGERGKIYVVLDENITMRWSGSSYIELVSSPGTTDSVPEGSNALYFTETRVRDTLLTGLTVAPIGTISATDKIIVAFAKLQKQLSDVILSDLQKAPIDSPDFSGTPKVPLIVNLAQADGQAANTSFVQSVVNAAVAILNAAIGTKLNAANGIASGILKVVGNLWIQTLGITTTAISTIQNLDLTTNEFTTSANHNFATGDMVLYQTTANSMVTTDGQAVGVKSRTAFVSVTAPNKVKLHTTRADAIAGTNVLDITAAGSGTETLSQAMLALTTTTASTGNGVGLDVFNYRYGTGSDWRTIATRVQMKTDITNQAYLEFNPPGNNYGALLKTTSAGKLQFAVGDSYVQLTVDQAGVKAVGDLQLNGVGVLTYTDKGIANGLAPLGADSKIAAIYLPSFVDDVLEYANLAAFPATGESSKIYVTLDTNKTYRWGGSAYVEISPSPGTTDAVPEGATNKYFTVGRVLATALAGLVTNVGGVIAAGDTVLVALGKLQYQISAVPYDVAGGMGGKPAANDVGMIHLAIRPFTIQSGTTTGRAVVGTAPTAGYTFTLLKNAVQIGTIVFTAGNVVATVTISADAAFVAGDVLKVTGQATPDTTLSDLLVTFKTVLN